ncbi:MAG: proton-conducting transporter membrane subunit, partial [Oleiharenicola lentus]
KAAVAQQGIGAATQNYAFGLLMFGFGILVSLWPLHTWAPLGYGAAPSSTAMLHAGVLKKFGLYGLIQIAVPLLPLGAVHWAWKLALLAAFGNVLVIGFVTMAQRDLKQMLGYSSVMHMGYCFLGIAAYSVIGTGGVVMLMVAHGLTAVAVAGVVISAIYGLRAAARVFFGPPSEPLQRVMAQHPPADLAWSERLPALLLLAALLFFGFYPKALSVPVNDALASAPAAAAPVSYQR